MKKVLFLIVFDHSSYNCVLYINSLHVFVFISVILFKADKVHI